MNPNCEDIQDAYHYALVSAYPKGNIEYRKESVFASGRGLSKAERLEYFEKSKSLWRAMGLIVPETCKTARQFVKVIDTTAHCLGFNAYSGEKF